MFPEILSPLTTAFAIIFNYWWAYTPILLFVAVISGWRAYVTGRYLSSLNWVLLELKAPPDVQKSPKVAEYIFANLHGIYSPVSAKKRFFKGEVHDWFSFEIVGIDGDAHFFIRAPEKLRNLVETQIFAQYPEAEIKQVEEDYIKNLPEFLPNDDYDLFGSELVLDKPDVFPIYTHPNFEEISSAKEEEAKRTDPLSSIFEVLSTLEPGEQIWIQILMQPTGTDWAKKAKDEIDEILGKGKKVERDFAGQIVDFIDDLIPGGSKGDSGDKDKKEKKEPGVSDLTPGKRAIVEKIEQKIAKLAYLGGVRFAYIGRKDIFHRSHVSAILGLFKQFSTGHLNGFKANKKTRTSSKGWAPWLFPSDKGFFVESIEFKKKWQLYQNLRNRTLVQKPNIFNIEELATIFHLPGMGIKAPLFPRVQVKKGQPPPGLPMK